jgi:6,7-dimethyl-8-ribityllumazine synthase
MEREPVVIWTTVGVLIGALLVRFVPDLGSEAINAVVDAVVVLGPVIAGAIYARGKVTPVASPKMNDGQPAALVPAAYWGQLVTRVQRAEARD